MNMCLISHKYTQFFETSITEIFIRIICKYIKKYQRQNKELYNSIREENSFFVKENLISYIPARVYNNIEDLTEEIIKHANCRSSTVTLSSKDKFNFSQPETIYGYTNIIKPNVFRDHYVRLLTSLHFPPNSG